MTDEQIRNGLAAVFKDLRRELLSVLYNSSPYDQGQDIDIALGMAADRVSVFKKGARL